MLAYAIRRVLWSVPTLVGISLVVFLVTALIPDPVEGGVAWRSNAAGDMAPGSLEELRRQRFLDLPSFVNAHPNDVRSRATAAVRHIALDDGLATTAEAELARLGGAALPYVIPQLDNLAPGARGRVAVALAPVALRMGESREAMLRQPDQATMFWARFWGDHSLDFTEPLVERAVHRLVLRASDGRARELEDVDTFALPAVMDALQATNDPEAGRVLAGLAAHCTGRSSGFLTGDVDTEEEQQAPLAASEGPRGETTDAPLPGNARALQRAKDEWAAFWHVHESDYRAYDGVERIGATLLQTRYGKWVTWAAAGRLGVSTRDGVGVREKLGTRAPVTLLLTLSALLVSYALAIPLGLLGAVRRGRAVDLALAALLFVFYSFPTFWAAELLVHAFSSGPAKAGPPSPLGLRDWTRLVGPVAALALGSLATLSRFQRASLLEVVRQDYVRTARAKGAPMRRILVVHALRNALLPTVTLAGLQFPALLGGAFVVEEVFGVPGLGYETLRAVEAHDAPWLVATVLLTAIVTTLALLASDVAYGFLDPRVREGLARRGAA